MTSGSHPRAARLVLVVYGLIVVVGIVLQIVFAGQLPAALGLAVSMPVLVIFLLLAMPASRLRRWVLVALIFSWFGDLSPLFLIKLLFFLVAQIAYVVGFWPYRRLVRPAPAVLYLAGIAVCLGVVASHAESLMVPVIAYGISLAAMAVLAFGVGRRTGFGGLLFLISDIELALAFFVLPGQIPYVGAINSLLYLPGQALIVLGVIARAQHDASPALASNR